MGRNRNLVPKVDTHNKRVRARWTSDTGRHELDLGPEDQPEVWRANLAKLHARLAEDPNRPARVVKDLLAPELFAQWLASDSLQHVTDRTHHKRAAILFSGSFPATAATEIKAADVEDWINALARTQRPDKSPRYSVGTLSKYLGLVKQAWRWAARRDLIPSSCWHAMELVANPRPGIARAAAVRPSANPDHVRAVLPHLRPPVRAIAELQAITGARPSELFRMRPKDILTTGKVTVEGVGLVDLDELGVWVYVPEVAKTAMRWLVLGVKAQEVIAPFLKDREPELPLFSPKAALSDLRSDQRAERAARGGGSGGDRKKPSQKQQRRPSDQYTAGTFRQAVLRACEKAGVPRFTPYQIRHLFAEMARDEHGMDHAQAAMGHNDPRTTQRYAKRSFKLAVEVARGDGK